MPGNVLPLETPSAFVLFAGFVVMKQRKLEHGIPVNSKRKKKSKITIFSTSSDQVIYLKLSSSLLGESMPIFRRLFIACSLMVVGVIFLRCYAKTHSPEYHEHEHRELRGSIPVHPSVEPVLKNNKNTIEMAKSVANVVIAEADHTLRQISGVMPGGNIAPPVV